EYCRAIEADLRVLSAAMAHARPAAVTIEALTAFCEAEHLEPSSPDARARYAASLGMTGDAIEWPPGRNSPCWCGSGVKYKKCCGGCRSTRATGAGLPADDALDGLGDTLGHPLVAPHPGRVADLRLAMAAALAVEGSPAAALEIAERTFDQLRAAGIQPPTDSVALALGYLVDLERA